MKNIVRSDIDRILFISDIHLGVRNASFEWIDNMTDYFDNFFIPLMRNYKDKGENIAVIIAGDFFDNRQHIDINIMNVGACIMEKLSAEAEIFLSIGNHDIYKKKDTNITSLRVFKSFKNVKLIEELTILEIKNGIKFLIVPWIGDSKEETQILIKHAPNVNYAVLHSDIAGLKYDNGRQIINGVNTTGIETKIYSGHIHKRQESKLVTYIGSPYQLRRSDIGNSKGIYSIKVTDKKVKEDFVENNYSPKFLKIQLDDILELNIEQIKTIIQNNYVDIIIKRKYMNDINVAKFMEVMDYCNTKKIELILDKLDTEVVDNDTSGSSDMSIEDIFKSRIAKMELSEEEVKKLTEINAAYLAQATDILGGMYEEMK